MIRELWASLFGDPEVEAAAHRARIEMERRAALELQAVAFSTAPGEALLFDAYRRQLGGSR